MGWKLTEYEIKKIVRWLIQNEEVTSKEVIDYVAKKFEKRLTWDDLKLLFINCTGDMDIRYIPKTDSWRFSDSRKTIKLTPIDP